MDKTKIKHDKNDASRRPQVFWSDKEDVVVHACPREGESTFHKEFGLWICRSGRGGSTPSNEHQTSSRYFEFFCISQLIGGTGFYRDTNTDTTVFNPGQGVLITPNQRHYYGGYHDYYQENTLCFTGRLAELMSGLGIMNQGVIKMDSPKRLLEIINCAMDPSITSQTKANIDLLAYLHDIYTMNRHKTTTGDLLDELTNELRQNQGRWWTVREMAKYCSMSDVRFRTVFRERNGMSPKKYLDQLKVNAAIEQLANQNKSVGEIATSLGYIDPFHFSRRFKELTGHSPRDYRKRVIK